MTVKAFTLYEWVSASWPGTGFTVAASWALVNNSNNTVAGGHRAGSVPCTYSDSVTSIRTRISDYIQADYQDDTVVVVFIDDKGLL